MPHYGIDSRQKLERLDARLVLVAEELIKDQDTKIIETARSDERQKLLFSRGQTTLDGITNRSRHQTDEENRLARAVDLGPYYADEYPRIPWTISPLVVGPDCSSGQARQHLENLKRWHLFAGRVLGIAAAFGIQLRWGGDWDRDHRFQDQRFDDYPHFEIVE